VGTLVIGNNNTGGTMADVLSGNTRLVKAGTGSIILSNLAGSSNTGGASLNGGTLRVGGGGYLGSGTVSFNGGTLLMAGNQNNAGYGLMTNPLFAVASTTSMYRQEQFRLHAGRLADRQRHADRFGAEPRPGDAVGRGCDRFHRHLRLDSIANAGGAGNLTPGLTNANVVGSTGKLLFTTDTQGVIAGWQGAGNVTIPIGELSSTLGTGTAALRNNTANTTATYQIGALGTSTTFGGSFIDGGDNNSGVTSVSKVGSGTLTLTGAGNSFRGALSVGGGVLQVNNALTGAPPITITAGTLLANAAVGTGPITMSGGNLVFNNVATTAHPSVAVNSTASMHLIGNTTLGTASGAGLSVAGGGTLNMADASINTLTITSGATNALTLSSAGTGANLNMEITNGGTSGTPSADQIVLSNPSATVSSAATNTGREYLSVCCMGGRRRLHADQLPRRRNRQDQGSPWHAARRALYHAAEFHDLPQPPTR
jgi:autotransporter-associated beta strand protein